MILHANKTIDCLNAAQAPVDAYNNGFTVLNREKEIFMTLSELEENVKRLKYRDMCCNLIKGCINWDNLGIYINQNKIIWEVYETERAGAKLVGIFFEECNLYDYVYCYFKKYSDENCWFGGKLWEYPEELIRKMKRYKIPESEYSFEGGMRKNCFCVEQKEMIDNGEISHNVIKRKDGTVKFDIQNDRFEQNGGKAETWEVYYSDGEKKQIYGTFLKEKDAYNFLFYLVMKKHVDIKKHWWYAF